MKTSAGLPVARMRSQPRGDRDRKLGVACVAEVALYGDKVYVATVDCFSR